MPSQKQQKEKDNGIVSPTCTVKKVYTKSCTLNEVYISSIVYKDSFQTNINWESLPPMDSHQGISNDAP